MRHRNPVLLCTVVAVLCGCSFLGDSAVHIETGNQTSGFLTRPLTLTASSDESVQDVAQRICDGVMPGSVASIAFVGKVPGPGPVSISDWGKYRYDCQPFVPAGSMPPVNARAAPPATAGTAGVAPVVPAAAPGAAASMPAPQAGAAILTDSQEQHRRECQRKQGAYQVCVGSCLASSSSPSGVVETECAQRCTAQAPVGCN
jgi:hypothetical protein